MKVIPEFELCAGSKIIKKSMMSFRMQGSNFEKDPKTEANSTDDFFLGS